MGMAAAAAAPSSSETTHAKNVKLSRARESERASKRLLLEHKSKGIVSDVFNFRRILSGKFRKS